MTDQNPSGMPPDPFEMFRRLWAPLGLPVPGMAMPTLDPAEVEKRIADLKSVETWLSMNLNMVKMAIQGLEVQKMALVAMRANVGAAGEAARTFSEMAKPSAGPAEAQGTGPTNPPGAKAAEPGANPMSNPMLWPWAMMQGMPDQAPSSPPSTAKGNEAKGAQKGKQSR